MLSVVGVASNGTSDFVIRTEGVALLAGAVFLWASLSGSPELIRMMLAGLGVYYVLGSNKSDGVIPASGIVAGLHGAEMFALEDQDRRRANGHRRLDHAGCGARSDCPRRGSTVTPLAHGASGD
jgi:hypothetical protein